MNTTSLRRRLGAAVIVVGLAGAACTSDSVNPPAATVNGIDISVESIEAEADAILANTAYRELIEQAGTAVLGAGDDTLTADFTAQMLTRRIAFELIAAELAEREVTITDEDRQSAQAAVIDQVGGQEVFDAFVPSYKEVLIQRTAEIEALQASFAEIDVSPEALKAYYDENVDDLVQACARHILVETEAEADDIVSQLAGGAEFETLAQETSLDTGSGAQGGDLGCANRGVYVPEFEDAIFEGPTEEVIGPVESQFGFHVIFVYERSTPTFEEARGDIEAQLASEASNQFSLWLNDAFAEAEVTIDPRYGSWSGDEFQPQVVPPEVPTPPSDDPTDGFDPITP